MKSYWKTLISLLVALPMLAYVAGTLVAAQQDPPQYEPIVMRPAEATASSLTVLNPAEGQGLPVLTTAPVEAITPGPDDLDDDSDDAGRDGRDDVEGADDSSGEGSRDDNDDKSGPRKDDDDDESGSGSDDDEADDEADDDSDDADEPKDDDADDRDDDSEPEDD